MVVEPTGSETEVLTWLGGQKVVVVLRKRIAMRPAETVRLRPDTRFVHLLLRRAAGASRWQATMWAMAAE